MALTERGVELAQGRLFGGHAIGLGDGQVKLFGKHLHQGVFVHQTELNDGMTERTPMQSLVGERQSKLGLVE